MRILIVGDQNVVTYDTGGGGLQGFRMSYPPANTEAIKRGFLAWQPPLPMASGNLTFITPAPPGPFMTALLPGNASVRPQCRCSLKGHRRQLRRRLWASTEGSAGRPAEPVPGRLQQPAMLACHRRRIASARRACRTRWCWRSEPRHHRSVAQRTARGWYRRRIALPFAILAAVIIARQVARPIHELTLASEAMALGDFDQRVEVARDDEVGRLAQAFSTMAERVGERDVQMRALVANVSHDLKTPMTSIMGYAQALQDGLIEPERVRHVAGVIRDQAATTNLLLADLLFLSEVDAGQTLPARQDVAASQLAAGAVERMQAAADQKGVSIELIGGRQRLCRCRRGEADACAGQRGRQRDQVLAGGRDGDVSRPRTWATKCRSR